MMIRKNFPTITPRALRVIMNIPSFSSHIISHKIFKSQARQIAIFCMAFLESSTRCWRLPTFAIKTIIGSTGLNFSVRNGKRCGPCDKSPTLKTRFLNPDVSSGLRLYVGVVVYKFLNRNRNISTSQLNALLRLHLKPINVIISHGS